MIWKDYQQIVCLALIPIIIACSKESDEANDGLSNNARLEIKFNVGCGNPNAETRSAIIEHDSDLEAHEIGVTARFTETSDTYFAENIIHQDTGWETPQKYYWPTQSLDFYARFPTSDPAISEDNTTNMTYTSQPYAVNQCDLMYATAYNVGKNSGEVPLDFCHALSTIGFKAKINPDDKGYSVVIKDISICNVKTVGKFYYPTTSTTEENAKGRWPTEEMGSISSLSIGLPDDVTLSSLEILDLTGEDARIMMIPQALTPWEPGTDESYHPIDDNCYLRINCKVMVRGVYFAGSDSEYGSVYVPFGGNFEQGCLYNYTLLFGTGHMADGSKGIKVEIHLEGSINDWNKESLYFDKVIL